ncbi:MAG: glycosyltransferase family 2 protein [Crocosphaera sp.]
MISVITPVYNGESFIESCIQVVIEQNCSDVEHIIVDGGSQDKTVEIIKQYADKYPHIRWISEADKGQSDAMNKGIKLAKGEILAILNVDDFYQPNVLNRVLDILNFLPNNSFLVGNCQVLNQNNQVQYINKPKKLHITDLLLGWETYPHPVNPSAYFYHKSLHEEIGWYDQEDHYTMDVDFLLRVVQKAQVKYVDELFGNYRCIPGTKTFTDKQKGESETRLQHLLDLYHQQLSPLDKIKFTIKDYWLRKFMARIKYYLRYPDEFLPSLIKKIN